MRPLGSTSVADIVKIQIIYPGQAIETRPSNSITSAPAILFQTATVGTRSIARSLDALLPR